MKETTSQPRRIDDSIADALVATFVSGLAMLGAAVSQSALMASLTLVFGVMFIGLYVGIRYQN